VDTHALLPNQRALFDIPEGISYLNCAYMSPLPRSSLTAGAAGLASKAQPWTISPPQFFETAEDIRVLAALLFNADSDDLAIVPSASYGLAVAAKNLKVQAGQNIIVLADQFPSNFYVWKDLARQQDGRLVTVPRPADGDWTRVLLESIDDQTAIAALPHCHWTDGTLVDLAAIREALDRVGAALVVDLTQSLGAMEFDTALVRPDFAVAAAYKWLLGPYSIGLLYVSPQYQQGTPIEHSWTSRIDAVHFSELTRYRADFAEGARRFDVGEKANFGLLPVLLNSLKLIKNWRVERIQPTLGAMTNIIAERAANLGLDVVSAPYRADHFVGLRFPQGLPKDLADCLARNKVYVSIRGDSVRVTPHLYTTAADIEQFFSALKKSI
tara:strand:- start:222 stop:1370 length:1149 start_codon:yes stop_codon:yes gene_type:complete